MKPRDITIDKVVDLVTESHLKGYRKEVDRIVGLPVSSIQLTFYASINDGLYDLVFRRINEH